MKEGARWDNRPERDRQIDELVGGQNPGSEAPPRSKKGGNKGDVRRGATAKGEMGNGGWISVIEGEEVRGDNPVKYFLSAGGWKYLLSHRGGDGN